MSKALKGGLGLLSWNINDNSDSILGSKTDTEEFLRHLDGQQIFCLQETKSEIKIPDYRCYNKLRSDSRSGGLCIGILREYQHLVEDIDTSHYPDIMAVRLSGDLLSGEDVVLVNVYDSQEHSSYKMKKSRQGQPLETLVSLSCFLSTLKYGTPYVIVGDMNARMLNPGFWFKYLAYVEDYYAPCC